MKTAKGMPHTVDARSDIAKAAVQSVRRTRYSKVMNETELTIAEREQIYSNARRWRTVYQSRAELAEESRLRAVTDPAFALWMGDESTHAGAAREQRRRAGIMRALMSEFSPAA